MKEQKTLKINVPEGYEIDRDKSTFEEIVFKKTEKKGLPERWEDLGEIDGWYVNTDTKIDNFFGASTSWYNKNLFTTEAQAKASVALAQLSQLLKAARDGWEPDWRDTNSHKSCIYAIGGVLDIVRYVKTGHFLSFPTKELAEEFLSKYKDLIKEASPLLFG